MTGAVDYRCNLFTPDGIRPGFDLGTEARTCLLRETARTVFKL
jgi:hypothetical protein